MKIRSRFVTSTAVTLASAGLLLGAATVHAGDNGFYVGASAGVNVAGDLTVSAFGNNGTTTLNPGARIDLYTGYNFRLGDHLTIAPELETGFLYNPFGNGTASGVNFTGGGDLKQVPVLANVVVGWPIAPKLSAYAGFGVGMAYFDVSAPSGPQSVLATTVGSFVWQIKAGIQYTLGPGDIGVSYEYLEDGAVFYDSIGNNAIMVSYTIHF